MARLSLPTLCVLIPEGQTNFCNLQLYGSTLRGRLAAAFYLQHCKFPLSWVRVGLSACAAATEPQWRTEGEEPERAKDVCAFGEEIILCVHNISSCSTAICVFISDL